MTSTIEDPPRALTRAFVEPADIDRARHPLSHNESRLAQPAATASFQMEMVVREQLPHAERHNDVRVTTPIAPTGSEHLPA